MEILLISVGHFLGSTVLTMNGNGYLQSLGLGLNMEPRSK